MEIPDVLERLKVWLTNRKDKFVQVDSWVGDTEAGFHTETHFDMADLLKQIDEFGEQVRTRAKDLGL